jgi:hypothetical protein
MKKLIALAIISLPFVLFYSCKHEPLLPEQQVSFENDIHPIIRSSCMHSGCHDTTGTGEFTMNTYEEVIENADVKPFDANGSKLYEVITETDPDDIMPQPPYSPLSDRNKRLIQIWILQGAKNN